VVDVVVVVAGIVRTSAYHLQRPRQRHSAHRHGAGRGPRTPGPGSSPPGRHSSQRRPRCARRRRLAYYEELGAELADLVEVAHSSATDESRSFSWGRRAGRPRRGGPRLQRVGQLLAAFDDERIDEVLSHAQEAALRFGAAAR